MAVGVYSCGAVKMRHRFFFSYIINLMKDWPGGSYIFMKSNPIVPGYRPLLSMGHK